MVQGSLLVVQVCMGKFAKMYGEMQTFQIPLKDKKKKRDSYDKQLFQRPQNGPNFFTNINDL